MYVVIDIRPSGVTQNTMQSSCCCGNSEIMLVLMDAGGGMTPSETFEKHAHNVHDHDEDETFERRNVG